MSDPLGPGRWTTVRRLPEKARYDQATIFAILDHAPFVTVAAVVDGVALTQPTLAARDGAVLYLHGSKSNAILRAVLDAERSSVTALLFDGLRVARSAFESSVAYRSAVVVGPTRLVDGAEKLRALTLLTDAALPGRSSEIRPPSEREVSLTLVVALDIEEGSAKVSAGPTDDDDDDLASAVWAGTVPARLVFGEPEPDTRGAMATGQVPVPPSVIQRRARG